MTLTLRRNKGSALTYDEMDDNFLAVQEQFQNGNWSITANNDILSIKYSNTSIAVFSSSELFSTENISTVSLSVSGPLTANTISLNGVTLEYASQADAEAGTSSTKILAPLQNRQAGLGRPHAILEDQKASGTRGQQFTPANTWLIGNLNTEVLDPDNIVTISSDRFTVTQDMFCEVDSTVYAIGTPRMRLFNVTDSNVVAYSNNGYGHPSYSGVPHLKVHGYLEANKTYRVEYRNTTTNGFTGLESSIAGVPEIYTRVKLWKR
jgi:hypothetical protein